jgi:hypothetical protein
MTQGSSSTVAFLAARQVRWNRRGGHRRLSGALETMTWTGIGEGGLRHRSQDSENGNED